MTTMAGCSAASLVCLTMAPASHRDQEPRPPVPAAARCQPKALASSPAASTLLPQGYVDPSIVQLVALFQVHLLAWRVLLFGGLSMLSLRRGASP